ncbi:hypothetical protein [Caldimonas tepidiphila]|uniref:hypothetical protein n=1 Tax=Caldimonas tepidiphila TaxID=2315841 RepID=UPI001300B3C3|nr:hypothetical protein [Caldimonas tepidiphila]
MNTSFGSLDPAIDARSQFPARAGSGAPAYLGQSGAALRPVPQERPRPAAEAWRRALAETGDGRPAAEDFRLGLVYLKSWPAIPDLPEEWAGPVTRVCALLSHKPTVGFLVSRVLELPEEESRRLLLVLHRFGHLDVLQQRRGLAEAAAEPMPAGDPGLAMTPPPPSAFLGRLWKKLVSR